MADSTGGKAVVTGTGSGADVLEGRRGKGANSGGFERVSLGDDDLSLAAGFGDLSLHRDIEGGGFAFPEGLAGGGSTGRQRSGGLGSETASSAQGLLAAGVALSFVRVKVAINTDFRLPRGTSMGKGENEVKMAFKYERLLSLCYLCGLVDHEMADCESPIPEGVDVKKPPYGDWLGGIPPRIPVWQRNGTGVDPEANNPFMTVSNRNRRSGVIPAPLPHRLMEENRPRLGPPPGFTPHFHPGANNRLLPPKRTRNTRQKAEDGGSEVGMKRPADDMEVSEDGEDFPSQ